MLADPAARFLFLEIRDEDSHQVSFAAIDLEAERLIWDRVTFEESWWIGATATDGKVLVLHTYQDSQNPEHKSYFAIDVKSRQMVWQSDNFQVLGIKGEWLSGYEKEDDLRQYKQVSIRNHSQKLLSAEEERRVLAAENKNMHYPFHYTEAQPYFETVKQFIIQYTNTSPLKGCEYLEYKDYILISYYIQENNALANYLIVIDTEGHLVLQETLDHHLTQIGLGTFFIAREKLILIKEKSRLISYAL